MRDGCPPAPGRFGHETDSQEVELSNKHLQQTSAQRQARAPSLLNWVLGVKAVMWHNDPVFGEVLQSVGLKNSPFRPLPQRLEGSDVVTKERMLAGLVRVFHCSDAKVGRNLVVVWALERPYSHSDGRRDPSTVIYIEKASGSIRKRWSERSLANLAEDQTELPLTNPSDLRHLATQNRNFTFYAKVTSMYGPFTVWRASAEELNAASGLAVLTAREWEQRLLREYWQRHQCFPLKNRQS